MIQIDTLIEQLQAIRAEHGNLGVMLQSDPEGNGYYAVRGGELGFYDSDWEYIYPTVKEAKEDGADFEDLRPCVVVFP